jgi:hypothetical protein
MTATTRRTPRGLWASLRDFSARGGLAVANSAGVIGRTWYVDTINGSNAHTGLAPDQAFATVAKAFANIASYDVVVIAGVVKEQVVAPLGVFDVTLVGAGNRPRQATSGGVPTGGGACWLAPTSPTAATALLELIEQGWTVANMLFSPVAASPCIKLTRAEDAVHPDPSHASILGCRFVGGGAGGIGVEDSGGVHNVAIEDCTFQSISGTAILGVAGAGIATPLMNRYARNYFNQCANNIDIGASHSEFLENHMIHTTTTKLKIAAGGYNTVLKNSFEDTAANIVHAHGYFGIATDAWRNYTSDTAADAVAVPTA